MATFSSITSQHLLAALAEHDEHGEELFLATHGYTASPDAQILHFGRRYDARAVMAVAHRHATGRLATPEEFRSSLDQAITVLRRRGFEVTGRAAVVTSSSKRSSARASAGTGAPRRKATPPERPTAVCPTCSMALPATGVCDECG